MTVFSWPLFFGCSKTTSSSHSRSPFGFPVNVTQPLSSFHLPGKLPLWKHTESRLCNYTTLSLYLSTSQNDAIWNIWGLVRMLTILSGKQRQGWTNHKCINVVAQSRVLVAEKSNANPNTIIIILIKGELVARASRSLHHREIYEPTGAYWV